MGRQKRSKTEKVTATYSRHMISAIAIHLDYTFDDARQAYSVDQIVRVTYESFFW